MSTLPLYLSSLGSTSRSSTASFPTSPKRYSGESVATASTSSGWSMRGKREDGAPPPLPPKPPNLGHAGNGQYVGIEQQYAEQDEMGRKGFRTIHESVVSDAGVLDTVRSLPSRLRTTGEPPSRDLKGLFPSNSVSSKHSTESGPLVPSIYSFRSEPYTSSTLPLPRTHRTGQPHHASSPPSKSANLSPRTITHSASTSSLSLASRLQSHPGLLKSRQVASAGISVGARWGKKGAEKLQETWKANLAPKLAEPTPYGRPRSFTTGGSQSESQLRLPAYIFGVKVPKKSGCAFGVGLEEVVERTRIRDYGEPRKVDLDPVTGRETRKWQPAIAVRCLEYLEEWGKKEEGIYRVNGASSQIAQLRAVFDSGMDLNLLEIHQAELDPHSVASLFKAWLREIPEPLVSSNLESALDVLSLQATGYTASSSTFLGGGQSPTTTAPPVGLVNGRAPIDFLEKLRDLFSGGMPPENFYLLRAIAYHLARLAEHQPVNKMSLNNLRLILSPTLNLHPIFLRSLVEEREILFSKPNESALLRVASASMPEFISNPYNPNFDPARHSPTEMNNYSSFPSSPRSPSSPQTSPRIPHPSPRIPPPPLALAPTTVSSIRPSRSSSLSPSGQLIFPLRDQDSVQLSQSSTPASTSNHNALVAHADDPPLVRTSGTPIADRFAGLGIPSLDSPTLSIGNDSETLSLASPLNSSSFTPHNERDQLQFQQQQQQPRPFVPSRKMDGGFFASGREREPLVALAREQASPVSGSFQSTSARSENYGTQLRREGKSKAEEDDLQEKGDGRFQRMRSRSDTKQAGPPSTNGDSFLLSHDDRVTPTPPFLKLPPLGLPALAFNEGDKGDGDDWGLLSVEERKKFFGG